MTCRYPDACQKKPDPRNELCRGCAMSVSFAKPEYVAKLRQRQEAFLARKFSWLPDDRRAEYERLKAMRYRAHEAKAMILQDMGRG